MGSPASIDAGPTGRIIDPRSMVGNALWNITKGTAESLWPLIKGPGQVLSGEKIPVVDPYPSVEPEANRLLSVPGYASDLAMAGMGIRGANLLITGGAFDPASIEHFPAWHGTPARQPFSEFDDAFMGSGEGAQAYGWGHYVAGLRSIAKGYRDKLAGKARVLLGDDGLPLNDAQVAQKFYEPGTIVPSYDGFDRVEDFKTGSNPWDWNVYVRKVQPIVESMGEKYGQGFVDRYRRTGIIPADALNDPTLWSDLHAGGPYVTPLRSHNTMPTDREIESVAAVRGPDRGWKLGQPGGLLHINVIPEEHELLDWDLPWNEQHPDVQDKLTKAGLSPFDVGDWSFGHHIPDDNPQLASGGQLYQTLMYKKMDDADILGDPYPAGRSGRDEAKRDLSKEMDAAGVPGLKFLDASSRNKPPSPVLKHADDFASAPNQELANRYLAGVPTTTGDVGRELDISRNVINKGMDRIRQQELTGSPSFIGKLGDHQDLLDWIDKEHAAGKFSIGDGRTRNYVIFDPKNLEIRTWNGRELTPVDHDPFAGAGR